MSQAAPAPTKARIDQVDLLRGLVIVIMALDHARDFFHRSGWAFDPIDFHQSDPALYLTRWVTHLCAPTFTFLAGASAFFQLRQGKALGRLSPFLLTRGLWLVVLDVTLISFALDFGWPYPFFLQTLWAIGWSMIALAGLVWLSPRLVLAIGVVIVAGHNLLDGVSPEAFGSFGWLWEMLHAGGPIRIGDQVIGLFLYPVLPWIGVMALGYGLGGMFLKPQPQRDQTLFRVGLGALAVFLALRGLNIYGDPRPWAAQDNVVHTLMDFFNVQKYPPSLDYVCATLGVALMLAPGVSKLGGGAMTFLRAFGAVPLFAYVLHFYLLHLMAMSWAALNGQNWRVYIGAISNAFSNPQAYDGVGVPLWGAYVAWALVLALIYPLCRWFSHLKATRRDWWLSYL